MKNFLRPILEKIRDRKNGISSSNTRSNDLKIRQWTLKEEDLDHKQKVLEEISKDGEDFRIKGKVDGESGQTPGVFVPIAKNRALQWQALLSASFEGKTKDAEATQEFNKQLVIESQTLFEESKKRLEEIQKKYDFDFRKFKFGMGLFYLFISLALILADYPLSYQMVVDGFQISGGKSLYAQIEPHLLAVGIVIVMLYTKIYYNKYLGSEISKVVTRFKSVNLKGIDDMTDKELKSIKRDWKTKFWINTLILLSLFALILFLGLFRYEVLKYMFESRPGVELPPFMDDQTGNGIGKICFILLSFLLPFISAIFAAEGTIRIQNYLELEDKKRTLKLSQESREKCQKKLFEAKRKLANYESDLKWVNSVNKDGLSFVEHCEKYLYACYLHGYERGMREGIPDEDLYLIGDFMRNKHAIMKACSNHVDQLLHQRGSTIYDTHINNN